MIFSSRQGREGFVVEAEIVWNWSLLQGVWQRGACISSRKLDVL